MIDLSGKSALVTGGSRGLGRAIALRLASLGARVAINYHSNEEAARAVVEEIKTAGHGEGIILLCQQFLQHSNAALHCCRRARRTLPASLCPAIDELEHSVRYTIDVRRAERECALRIAIAGDQHPTGASPQSQALRELLDAGLMLHAPPCAEKCPIANSVSHLKNRSVGRFHVERLKRA